MNNINTSGKALAEHWKWAAEKGLMNINTANALRAACTQVLGVVEGWESVDVREINIADICHRFQNKRSKDFTPESLETYKRRFMLAVKEFLKYSNDPSAWRAPAQNRPVRKEKKTSASTGIDISPAGESDLTRPPLQSGLVDYPFPLREGCIVHLKLPVDLKASEVRRLHAYLMTLAVDFESTQQEK